MKTFFKTVGFLIAFLIVSTISVFAVILSRINLKKYIHNLLISLDQLGNVLTGGDPDETISARLGRNWQGSWMERLVDWMFSWQNRPDGHCENAHWWEQDEGKDQIIASKDNKNNIG